MKTRTLILILFIGMICVPLSAIAEQAVAVVMIKQNAENMWKPIKETQPHITASEFKQIRESGESIVLLDVRTKEEYTAGHLPGATNIPRGLLEFKAPKMLHDPNVKIYTYCRSGARGALACDCLKKLGYKNVTNIYDGFIGWVLDGYKLYGPCGEFSMGPDGFEKKDPYCHGME